MATATLAAATVTLLPACAPLLIGGAMIGGVLMTTDRRSTGAQVEDEAIEFKAGRRIGDAATLGHVNVASYNRTVLLTGEVPDAATKAAVEAAARQVDNVRMVVNEVAVTTNSSFGSRSNDALLSTRVKASLVDAKDLQANAVKVTTERGTVYLLGRVTEREAARAAEVASTVPGVQKVVRVFEVLTERELAQLPKPTQ
ncbi:MAG: BON domain-containing protein [Rubrivivax sp.]